MSELDIDALKRLANGDTGFPTIALADLRAIIAALEDRERLRRAAQSLIDYYWSDPGPLTREGVIDQLRNELAPLLQKLKAALEDHDD